MTLAFILAARRYNIVPDFSPGIWLTAAFLFLDCEVLSCL